MEWNGESLLNFGFYTKIRGFLAKLSSAYSGVTEAGHWLPGGPQQPHPRFGNFITLSVTQLSAFRLPALMMSRLSGLSMTLKCRE